MSEAQRHVFIVADGEEHWVARDLGHVKGLLRQIGLNDKDIEDYGVEPMPDDQNLSIWCDKTTGRPSEPGDDNAEVVTRTASEWAAREDYGMLCTVNQ